MKINPWDLKPIQLRAEIDLSVEPNECRIQAINGSPWSDLGYWLEAVGWLATSAMTEKEMTEDEMADYVRQYVLRCLKDYKPKPSAPDAVISEIEKI